ncbi:MAG: hypothetical protein JNM69_22775 [Archangium sp.]|nr:hypothetical protein [Archangium sp.]
MTCLLGGLVAWLFVVNHGVVCMETSVAAAPLEGTWRSEDEFNHEVMVLRPGGVVRALQLTQGVLAEATDVRTAAWSLDGGVLVLGNSEPSSSWRVDARRLEVAPPMGPTFRRVRCLGAD